MFVQTFPKETLSWLIRFLQFWGCPSQSRNFFLDPSCLELWFFPKKYSNSSLSFLAFLRFPVSETYPKVSSPLCPISNFQSTNRNRTFGLFSLTWWIKVGWLKKIFQLFYQKLLYNFYHENACKRTGYTPFLVAYPPAVFVLHTQLYLLFSKHAPWNWFRQKQPLKPKPTY